MLNGKQASRSQVLKLAQSFCIQIDNLCQFLPQDKVSEFAALTPIELLYSTQRAAAGPEMIEWHDNLKTLRAEQKKLQSTNTGDRDLLANLVNRQEMQRPDVERMRERAQIKRKIEMLEFVRPVTKYKQAHAEFKDLKKKKDDVSRELEILKSELEPALRAVNAKQTYCVQLDGHIDYKKRGVETADQSASNIAKTIERHDESMKDLDNRINVEKKQATQYKQEATKIQQAINRLTRQLNDESISFDVDWYNEQIVGSACYKYKFPANFATRAPNDGKQETLRKGHKKSRSAADPYLKPSIERRMICNKQNSNCEAWILSLDGKKQNSSKYHLIPSRPTNGCKKIKASLKRKFLALRLSSAPSKIPNTPMPLNRFFRKPTLLPSPRRAGMISGHCKGL